MGRAILTAGFVAFALAAQAASAAAAQNYDAHDRPSIVAGAFKPNRQVCNRQGVCCTLDALGNIADCLIPGSSGSPGNPGQYTDNGPMPGTAPPPGGCPPGWRWDPTDAGGSCR
ncbi:hypothetical protein MINTM003_16600 [Mycobacterium paraintracellulare]|nr:hypothetical protein MINTM003_16600 [Mycobacterium paraintracellulare]BCO88405.1 hypothetical protein MINTM015_16620 [Mycobacterium paraintracellulare]